MQRSRQPDDDLPCEGFRLGCMKDLSPPFEKVEYPGFNGHMFFCFIVASAKKPVCFLFAVHGGQADVAMVVAECASLGTDRDNFLIKTGTPEDGLSRSFFREKEC